MKRLLCVVILLLGGTPAAIAQAPTALSGRWVGDTVLVVGLEDPSPYPELVQWAKQRTLRLQAGAWLEFDGQPGRFVSHGANLVFDEQPKHFEGRYQLANDTLTLKPEGQPRANVFTFNVQWLGDGRLCFPHPKDGRQYLIVFRRAD